MRGDGLSRRMTHSPWRTRGPRSRRRTRGRLALARAAIVVLAFSLLTGLVSLSPSLAPRAADLSQDDFIRWVDEWRLASALRVEPVPAARARDEIRIRLRNGGELTLGVISREPELVLARSDEKLQYRFGAGLAKRLLSPPAAREEGAEKK